MLAKHGRSDIDVYLWIENDLIGTGKRSRFGNYLMYTSDGKWIDDMALGREPFVSEYDKQDISELPDNVLPVYEAVDVAPPSLNDWLSCKTYPRIGKIQRLADYFGILKSDLIEDKQKKPDADDGLTDDQRKFIEFVRTIPADKVARIHQAIQLILEAGE